MSKVVHLRKEPYDVRIDRLTQWGNPFHIGPDASRDEVIALYKRWATSSQDPAAVWIREHVHELRGKVLGCWCAPSRCHGDVLLEMAEHAHEWTSNGVCKACGRDMFEVLWPPSKPINPFCREPATCSGSCQREIACNE